MAAILIGTASWADRSLIDSGLFYPPSVKAADERLRYYATQFPLVEVDSSYYALPAARNAALWAARTPDGFVFDVKAFRLFTQHQTPPSALPKDIRDALEPIQKNNLYYRDLPEELLEVLWARFRSALEPLRAAGKLGVVLFQFPPWFVYRPSHLDHLLLCQRMLADYPIAVEFRHGSWFEPRRRAGVLDFERRHGLVHVVADEPQGFPPVFPPYGKQRRRWRSSASTAETAPPGTGKGWSRPLSASITCIRTLSWPRWPAPSALWRRRCGRCTCSSITTSRTTRSKMPGGCRNSCRPSHARSSVTLL